VRFCEGLQGLVERRGQVVGEQNCRGNLEGKRGGAQGFSVKIEMKMNWQGRKKSLQFSILALNRSIGLIRS